MVLILFILCLFVVLSDCQQNPTISFITKERIVNIGDTIDLSCSVQYARDYPVIWAKINRDNPVNHLFISKGSSLSIPDNRYSIRHDDASSTYTLQISKIQEIDAGHYQCQVVIGTSSRVTADVNVYVRIPPVISDNSTRSVITSAGASISLQCYSFGYPQPSISWRRENNDLLPTGGALYRGNILIIHNITKNDRGTYYCIADNNVGKGARRNVGVEVEFPPSVTIDRPRYEQALQYDADLHCHIESFPTPSIIWLKDGYELKDSQHHHISIFSTSHEFTDSVLRVKRIEKRHYGEYVCKAINKLGTDQKVIQLRESVNPMCPPSCGIGYAGFIGAASHPYITNFNIMCLLLISLLVSYKLSTQHM
ncbi:lachesin-like [Oppia nitens]|uniref:lachesin-like n=1 Tax=Oppia nitens TaxID=1686743 RepID=UPI0023DA5371|nr:lachesin-like [Oppia nitens]